MEDFVSFELSKKLKENGFPQRPDYFNHSSYYEWDGLRKIHPLYNVNVWFDPCTNRDNLYFAPTIPQVLKWLREEKNIICLPHIDPIEEKWFFYVTILPQASDFPEYMSSIIYNNYEDAALAGVEYVLDNLI
jgi:hypothetical protein